VTRLSDIVSRGAPPSVRDLEVVFQDFASAMEGPPPAPRDGVAYLRKLATAAMGDERARRVLPEPAGPSALESLRGASPQTLAELIAEEHPQIAAVVLAQLPREQGAKVLAAMGEERQRELLPRLAALKEIPAHAAQMLSDTLAKALAGEASGGERSDFDGVSFVAGLLNEVPAEQSETLLAAREERGGGLATRVREKRFTFEDLLRVPARGLQILMREVPADSLLVALKTASEALREHLLGALSTRAAAQVREDLSLAPPTRLSEVERAQREVIEVVQRLAAEGKVNMPGRGGGEAMV
jgi:flagellar motor switch protein FliG